MDYILNIFWDLMGDKRIRRLVVIFVLCIMFANGTKYMTESIGSSIDRLTEKYKVEYTNLE